MSTSKSVRSRIGVLIVFLAVAGILPSEADAQIATAWPLKKAPSARYLVDQNNIPFPIHGDTAWNFAIYATREQVDEYLDDRKSKGFNAVLFEIVQGPYYGGPTNMEGNDPFTKRGDPSTPNDAYFQFIDYIVTAAKERGILCFIFPSYLGYEGGTDGILSWFTTLDPTVLRNYGRWIGSRYSDNSRFGNIIWVGGGDRDPRDDTEMNVIRQIQLGIRDSDPTKLHTVHPGGGNIASEVFGAETWFDINTTYTYGPTRGDGQRPVYEQGWEAYNSSPTRPAFLIESYYEGYGIGPRAQRSQSYTAWLSGSMGQVFGNGVIMLMSSSSSPPFALDPDWPSFLDSSGAQDQAHVHSLINSVPWHLLVPDQSNVTLTRGHGAWGTDDRASCARASDGSVALVYMPKSRTVTVDMGRLSGMVTARWYNPTTGTYRSIGTFSNKGRRNFSGPGDNGTGDRDWILILEAVV